MSDAPRPNHLGLIDGNVWPATSDHLLTGVQVQLKSGWVISPLLLLISSFPEASVCLEWMYISFMNIL